MNEIVKLTLSEIQNNPPLINKKFLLINSLFYTDDAFNYLLSLIDNTDCVAFYTCGTGHADSTTKPGIDWIGAVFDVHDYVTGFY